MTHMAASLLYVRTIGSSMFSWAGEASAVELSEGTLMNRLSKSASLSFVVSPRFLRPAPGSMYVSNETERCTLASVWRE